MELAIVSTSDTASHPACDALADLNAREYALKMLATRPCTHVACCSQIVFVLLDVKCGVHQVIFCQTCAPLHPLQTTHLVAYIWYEMVKLYSLLHQCNGTSAMQAKYMQKNEWKPQNRDQQ